MQSIAFIKIFFNFTHQSKPAMSIPSETTIHDIAKKLNISASTVSRALNDNPIISASTRKRIKKAAKEMGYRPNSMAANFRTKRTHTIGVIVPLINRHFFSSVISGIEEVAYNQGYTVAISQSNDNLNKESKIAQTLFANRVDGLIISIGMETTKYDHLKLFTERNIPLVFFDRIVDEIKAPKIVVDDFGGALKLTRHLIEQGARKIAHIGGPLNLKIYEDRRSGYIKALNDAGLEVNESIIVHNNLRLNEGTEAIQKIVKTNAEFDAVFCANDTTALSTIIYLKKLGIKVPDDVAVMGFSNEPFSEFVTPSISTVKQPGFLMGKKAAEIIINQIDGKTSIEDVENIIMPTELIIRESSKKLKIEKPQIL